MANTGGLTGQTLGQYELRELLGRGGMGAVYRAYQHSLKREVAIKVLSDMLTDEPGYIERFNAEARTAAALEHPHIVPIHDFGTQNDMSYVVMRFLTGGSLHERMRAAAEQGRGTPSMTEIAELLAQVASALDYAHHEGVVHRDIKPQNIMFDNHGKAYVVDFGIAKLLHQTAMTMSGMALGSPSYMPPEQWRGEGITGAADQYALAVTVYALVAGRLPFEGDSQQQLMYKHLSENPPALSVSRPDLPPALTLVMNRALAKEASERFPNCTQFAQAFRAAIEGIAGEATNYFSFKLPKQERKPSTMAARPAATPQSTPRSTPPKTATVLDTATTPAPPSTKRGGSRGLIAALIAAGVVAVAALIIILGNNGNRAAMNATETAIALLVLAPTDTPTTEASATGEATATDEPTADATATDAATPTDAATATDEPTSTDEPTMDALAIAQATRGMLQTGIAATQQAADFQATVDALQTALFLEDMTATATLWTATPEPTVTDTPTKTPTPEPPTATATLTATATPTDTATATDRPSRTPLPTRERTLLPMHQTATSAALGTLPPSPTRTLVPMHQTATQVAIDASGPTIPGFGYTGDENRTIFFTNETTGSALSFLWDFGDGSPRSTLRDPEHTYAESGVYTVTLTVGGVSGQESVQQQVPVIIPSVGTANFDWTNDGLNVQFENGSGNDALSFRWNFGDGTLSIERDPSHTYAEPGTYVVRLIAGTLDGPVVAEQVVIIAAEPPDVDAYYVQTGPTSAAFMFSSSGNVFEVEWHFGDGEHSEDFIAFHEYAEMGSYEVELVATGPGGTASVTEAITLVEGCIVEPAGSDPVPLRAAPSRDAEIVAMLANDEIYTAWTGRDEDGNAMYHVFHDNIIAWVSADEVAVVEGECPQVGG